MWLQNPILPGRLPAVIFGYLALIPSGANADFLEVVRAATIKAQSQSDANILERVEVGTHLNLVGNGLQNNGYYEVWSEVAQRNGWIYRTLVRKRRGESDQAASVSSDSQAGFDGRNCGRHLMYGVPFSSDQILCRQGYALGYNYQVRVGDWASYNLTRASVFGENVPRGNYRVDRSIPLEFRSGGTDYDEPLYDRGHLAPSAAIDFSRSANDETFLYSNMTPQVAGFNQNMNGRTGVWGAIEDLVRENVRAERVELYVVSGTHFADDVQFIGTGVGVPDHFFKIVFDPLQLEVIAFWMPQDEDTAHLLQDYVRTVDFIEEQTGFDFLSTISDGIQSRLESIEADIADWLP